MPDAADSVIEACRDVAYKTIERTLENEGLEFAAFLTGKSDESQPVEKYISQCLDEQGAAHADISEITLGANAILNAAFLEPTDDERLLYSRLGAVYTILFCLRTEPKIIKYFEQMAGHFCLYIGADVIVKALSERFIPDENKIFRKTLKLIKEAGGSMRLAESVLEEVQYHIFSSSQEFKHRYMDNEDAISVESIPYVDRPLIRSYYYGKYSSEKNRPRNWWQFLNGFCDTSDLTSERTKEELKKYLQVEFGLIFESKKELETLCEDREVNSLARLLEPHKKEKQLAYNDALMVHVIYARRSEDGEANESSIFGSKTWWLTNEHTVIQYTHELVRQEGCRFLMRPDYLLNFLTFLPKTTTARKTFNQLFPSMLGVHLARLHLPEDIQRLHQHLSEAKMLDASRRTVLIEGLINKLKGDHRQPSWYQCTQEAVEQSG